MDELKVLYRRALPGRIDELEAARASPGGVDEAARTTIRRIAHSLRGSGGTYGFPEISAAAAAVEEAAQRDLPQRLDALITLLRTAAAGESDDTAQP